MNPEKIGRYEIKSELGRGGMATVYQAYDPRFEREVAVKVLPSEMLHDPQFRIRFEREAKTIAMLEHPAIVPVYDFGEEDGLPYFVMRYMTGGSLSERIKPGPLPVQQAAHILEHIAPGLDEAHAKGIIHRDLKPGNILFDRAGEPYVSDFGIAKFSESQTNVTGSAIIGTPSYMSPEQAQGEEVDGRSDIYALGVILFEMLTGRQPYQGDTPMSVVVKHITEPVPHILDVNPNLPPAIEAVIEKVMAKDKSKRFATAKGLADALNAVARGESPDIQTAPAVTRLVPSRTVTAKRPAPAETVLNERAGQAAIGAQARGPVSVPRRKRGGRVIVFGIVILLVCAAATAGLLFVFKDKIPALSAFVPTMTVQSIPQSTLTPGVQNPTREPGNTAAGSGNPTGLGGADMIAFLGSNDVWVMKVDGTGLRPLTSDGVIKHDLQWTPDGESVIYITGKCIRIVNITTGESRDITCFVAADYLEAFEISPDGKQVAISLNRELYVVPYDLNALGGARAWTQLRDMKGCFTYTDLGMKGARWSSDGKKIAVGIVGVANGRAEDMVRVFDISQCDSKHPNILDTFPGPRFQMKGYGDNPVIQYFDWNGETLFLLNSSVRNGGYGYLYSYNLESKLAETIDPIGTTCCYRDTRWSPDGTYILFAYQDINLTGSQAAIQLYYTPYGTLGTGVKYTPFNLPGGFFKTPSERIQASLRPVRSAK